MRVHLIVFNSIKACVVYVYGDLQLTFLYAVWTYGFRRAEV